MNNTTNDAICDLMAENERLKDTATAWQALAEKYQAALEERCAQVEHLFQHSGRSGSRDYDALEISAAWDRLRTPLVPNVTKPADALARRDEKMKALWQAEWIEGNIDRTLTGGFFSCPVFGLEAKTFMRREAAALRQKAGQ